MPIKPMKASTRTLDLFTDDYSGPEMELSTPGVMIASPVSAALAEIGSATFSIVKRPQGQSGFVPLPKRWVVERTFAWISNCRRLARDYERHIKSVAAFVKLAMIKIMLRRLARKVK